MYIHMYEYSHNSMIPMYSKFDDDIYLFLVIMKNVLILFVREYRGLILGPPCDIIDDIITLKNTLGQLFISEVKLKLCSLLNIFQNGHHFEVAINFVTRSNTGNWIYQQDSHE